MNSKVLMDLTEAYVAVYDDDLRSEIEYEAALTEDDLSFIDDYSDNELTQIMEEIFDENLIDIDECFETLDLVISEAVVTSSENRPTSSGSRRVTIGAQDRRMAATTAARTRKVRIGRMAQAAQTAAETKAKQGVSAFGRAASAAGRGIRSGASAVGQKLQAGKQKITNFLGKVGRVAKAAKDTARKEFSGEAERQAKLKSDFRKNVRSARQNARAAAAKDTSEFDRPAATPSTTPASSSSSSGRSSTLTRRIRRQGRVTAPKPRPAAPTPAPVSNTPTRERASSGGIVTRSRGPSSSVSPSSTGRALPPANATTSPMKGGERRPASIIKMNLGRARKQGAKALNSEELTYILGIILEDLIQEGYAHNIDEAYEIVESLYDDEFDNLVESYLDTDVETYDFYDTVMDYLLDEGFADTEEDAEVIMANMSDEWRDDILEYSNAADPKTGRYIDPEHPENVAAAKERSKRRQKRGGGLTFQDNSDPRRTGGRRPSRWN